MLKLITTGEKNRQDFAERYKPMSRKKFEDALQKMEPEQRADFEREMRTPYKQRIEEGMRAVREAIREFQQNPTVRKQAMKEAEEALAKARGHNPKRK